MKKGLDIEAEVKKLKEEESIKCPHCGFVLTDSDLENYSELVTYWGEDAQEVECSNCDKTYFVREWVRRTYKVGETQEEAQEI